MISEPAALPSPVADVYERGISIDAVSKKLRTAGASRGLGRLSRPDAVGGCVLS